MRVAYVCADAGIPVFGTKGASVHVQAILRAFVRRGDRVDLYAARIGGDVPAGFRTIGIHPLQSRPNARRLEANAADAHLIDELVAATLAEQIRSYDLVYERHSLWSSSAMRLARVRDVPAILEINAPLVEEQLTHRRLLDPDRARAIVGKALEAAKLRVAVSEEVARRHADFGFSLDDFLICPNGVDPERFAIRSGLEVSTGEGGASDRRPPRADSFTVGFLGTLKPWHGLDVLLDAFARLAGIDPGYRLLIVGDGPMREALETRLDREGLRDRAELTGAVDPAEVPRWLARMDVGTAPYARNEGHYFSPLKIVEYQAAGLPVVASGAGQVRDLVRDGIDGWLVAPGDARTLADRVARLRADPDGARTMGSRGREHVLATRTWDAVLARILDALRETIRPETVNRGPSRRAEIGNG
ncbi:MAG: glycosyltransferase family 4 protein [Deltaproteobacteria bacterium]|nr:glycosyltransferase family 4 protein [Deltaproteobacteria bacterium]